MSGRPRCTSKRRQPPPALGERPCQRPASATARGSRRPTGEPILELHKLEKRYTGTHALKPCDLAFEAGEIHAIVGENGAGKSTLIKLLTGVTPRTAGEIIWKAKPVATCHPARSHRARHQRRPPGSGAVPASHGGRQHVPRRRGDVLRPAAAARHGARRAEDPRRSRLRPAGRRAALEPHHRPAAADRDRARRDRAARNS